MRDKAISGSFINRIQSSSNPTTGSAPILGITEQSIINNVKSGQMKEYRKMEGTCTNVSEGCPCAFSSVPPEPTVCLNAQWATILSQATNDISTSIIVQGVKTDSNNNVYVSGYYISPNNTFIIQNANGNTQTPSSITLPTTPVSTFNPFIVKYNSAGIVQWATNIPANSSAAFTGSQNIYVTNTSIYMTGIYLSTTPVDLNNASGNTQVTSGIQLQVTTGNAYDAFIVKYDFDGQVQWGTTIRTTNNDSGVSVTFDSSNNLYITGYYFGSSGVLFNANGLGQVASPITLPPASGSLSSVFIAKYSYLGQALWATNINGTGNDRGISITKDSSNNIYVVGNYASTLQINLNDASGTGQTLSNIFLPATATPVAILNTFLVKYKSNGAVQWATSIPSSTRTNTCNNVLYDNVNNIYITGFYSSPSSITLLDASGTGQIPSSITLPVTSLTATFNFGYLIKYNTSGKAQWATYIANKTVSANTSGISLAMDLQNNIYMAGSYTTNCNIYDASGTTQKLSQVTVPDIFNLASILIKYNTSGTALCATYLAGTDSILSNSCTIDSANNIYLLGRYASPTPITINNAVGTTQIPSQITLLPEDNFFNGYIVKYQIQ
jgi:hypothetical protein